MKHITLLITCLVLIGSLQLSAQDPVAYMNKISQDSKEISQSTWEYTSAIAHDKGARKVEKTRTNLLKTIMTAKSKVERMKGYEGNTSYRDTILSFLEINYNVINEDYAKIVDMEAVAEQSYDGMEAYMLAQDMASAKLNRAGDMLKKEEEKFAEDHNINLIKQESKLAEKMKKAGEVFKYYRVIYLIFFKSYIQEAHFMDALNAGDVSGMEQTRGSLQSYAEEGLKKLAELESYAGDNTVINACKEMLEFYQTEANEKAPLLTDFLLKNEKFQKIKEAFEAKKEKDRTQADADKFNNAVEEVNAGGEVYNKTNQELNAERSAKLENWNKAVKRFLNKHTPRG